MPAHRIYHCCKKTSYCIITNEYGFKLKKGMKTMNKKEEIISRIEKLSDKQFELLMALYSQQERESVQVSQSARRSFLQPSA